MAAIGGSPGPPPNKRKHILAAETELVGRGLPPFMAASTGSPGLLTDGLEMEESGDPDSVPNKRKKILAAETELVAGSNAGTEEDKEQTRSPTAASGEGSIASPAAPIDTPPLRLRFPPFPTSGKSEDVRKWDKEFRRISEICAKDPRRKLPTLRKPKDADTIAAVQSPRDKVVVRGVARSTVTVSSIPHDGSRRLLCTGIIMGQWESNGKQHNIIVTCASIVCKMGSLLDPLPKLLVGLPDQTILDGKLMFFSDHYDIALLEIDVDYPLQRPSIGSGPNYGQDVFVLARDKDSSLMVRHGDILWLEESDYLGRNYQMFLSCEVPPCGNGGPVIDHDGNVTGMAFHLSPYPAVLSISTIVMCIEMWLKFSRIARPIHGLGVRTFGMLDVSLQEEISLDHSINSGFIVDTVDYDSAAETYGIAPGDVIVSFDDQHSLTLPQLEDYLLSVGWMFLNNSSSRIHLQLQVYDLIRKRKRSITLPVEFCDG